MNRYAFFVTLCVMILVASCSQKVTNFGSEPSGTIFVESPGEGLITIKSDGFGSNIAQAETDAITRSFETILFRGIPEHTGLSRSLISSESQFNTSHPGWLDKFIKSGSYERFVQKDFGSKELPMKKGKRVSRELTINYKNLRSYLEEEGLIRKFGY